MEGARSSQGRGGPGSSQGRGGPGSSKVVGVCRILQGRGGVGSSQVGVARSFGRPLFSNCCSVITWDKQSTKLSHSTASPGTVFNELGAEANAGKSPVGDSSKTFSRVGADAGVSAIDDSYQGSTYD